MRRLARLSLVTALLAGGALGASAESWGATAHPARFENGARYCMLWYGEAAPLMNITVTEDAQTYLVVSSVFNDVPTGAATAFAFTGGKSISVGPMEKPRPQQYPGFISGDVSDDALSTILARMALGSGGEDKMSVAAGVWTQDFPLRSSAGDAALFQACKAEL
jgi:hypothetical protein